MGAHGTVRMVGTLKHKGKPKVPKAPPARNAVKRPHIDHSADDARNAIDVAGIAQQAALKAIEVFHAKVAAGETLVTEQVIEKSVNSALYKLGIDISDPVALRADMLHLREWRVTMQLLRAKGVGAFMTAMVSAMVAVFGGGIYYLLHRAP